MLIVKTKEQLKHAKDTKVNEFTVVGELAEKLYKAQKISKLSKRAAMLLAGAVGAGAVAAPFTGGLSLGVTAVAATTTVGSGAIVAAVALGGIILVYTIFKEYSFKIKVSPKGEYEIVFVSKKN